MSDGRLSVTVSRLRNTNGGKTFSGNIGFPDVSWECDFELRANTSLIMLYERGALLSSLMNGDIALKLRRDGDEVKDKTTLRAWTTFLIPVCLAHNVRKNVEDLLNGPANSGNTPEVQAESVGQEFAIKDIDDLVSLFSATVA